MQHRYIVEFCYQIRGKSFTQGRKGGREGVVWQASLGWIAVYNDSFKNSPSFLLLENGLRRNVLLQGKEKARLFHQSWG